MVGLYISIIIISVYLLFKSRYFTNMMFKRWCKNNNILYNNIDIGYFENIRGLCATSDIQKGDLLVEIPYTSCISERVPPDMTTEQEDYILARKLAEYDTWFGKYSGYMHILPKDPHLIADWSDSEIEQLKYHKAYELRENQQNENKRYLPHMKKYLDLVRSRRILNGYDDHNLLIMIPFVDMINHDKNVKNVDFEFDLRFEDDKIRLYSSRNYKKGEQIVVSYGDPYSEKNSVDHHLTRHGIFLGDYSVPVTYQFGHN